MAPLFPRLMMDRRSSGAGCLVDWWVGAVTSGGERCFLRQDGKIVLWVETTAPPPRGMGVWGTARQSVHMFCHSDFVTVMVVLLLLILGLVFKHADSPRS
jgi:hypothetical protein